MTIALKIIGGIVGLAALIVVAYFLFYFAIPYWRAPDSLDKAEASKIIDDEIRIYRAKPYDQLVSLVGKTEYKDIQGPSGKKYYVEVSGYWDGEPNSDVRVMASISDGGKSAYIPMTTDFITSPSGQFIGE